MAKQTTGLLDDQAVVERVLGHVDNAAEGATQLKNSLAIWDASGGKCWSPCAKSVLAEGLALSGDLDGALQLIDEQIEQVKRPGWEERYY